jgi:hypothetical protein
MRLLSHALAAVIGYLLGRPEGRERLARVGRQAVALTGRAGNADDAGGTVDSGSDAGPAAARHRRGVSAASWRRRFTRSRTVHFPPSANVPPPTSLGGTTVMEDSEAAVLGMPVTPRSEVAPPRADRP